MPHVTIQHFPLDLGPAGRTALVRTVTEAVCTAFGCEPGVVSIALEPVPAQDWQERVYRPAILARQDLLVKTPEY